MIVSSKSTRTHPTLFDQALASVNLKPIINFSHRHLLLEFMRPSLLLLSLTFLLASCNSFGPDSLKGSHPLYNEAINDSMNEQFMLNLVRLHYFEPTFFLDVTNVAATMKLDFNGGLDQTALGVTDSASDLIKFTAGSEYYTQPTISFAPLQGEAFVRSLLSPITLESIFQLTNSGWSARRTLGLCVERINDLENVPTGSGPMPQTAPNGHDRFQRLMDLVETVRAAHIIIWHYDESTKQSIIHVKNNEKYQKEIMEIKELLDLDPKRDNYIVTGNSSIRNKETISIESRSLMSIMFYLSHNVDAPPEHEQAGLVRVTKNGNNTFEWSQTPAGKIFRIRQSDWRPQNGFLAVPYLDHWYYIEPSDLETKATFMLLTQLFRLQAGASKFPAPVLTVPVR
jgi:hypothetical protein